MSRRPSAAWHTCSTRGEQNKVFFTAALQIDIAERAAACNDNVHGVNAAAFDTYQALVVSNSVLYAALKCAPQNVPIFGG
jgi:hypothetical protein